MKPVVGIIDFTTRTTQAISYTTSSMDMKIITRFRPPRYIGPDKVLQVHYNNNNIF